MRTDWFIYVIEQADLNRFRNVLERSIAHAMRLHFKCLFDQFKYDMKDTAGNNYSGIKSFNLTDAFMYMYCTRTRDTGHVSFSINPMSANLTLCIYYANLFYRLHSVMSVIEKYV